MDICSSVERGTHLHDSAAKKRLSTFLSSVIAVILAAMSILLLHTVIKEYTNSTHVSYSRDVNLLYSYLEQVSILDIPILTEYSEKISI